MLIWIESVVALKNLLIARRGIKCDEHYDKQHHEPSKCCPDARGVSTQRRRLILVDTDSRRRIALEVKCFPDVAPGDVFAHRPYNLFSGTFARYYSRRADVVRDVDGLADAHLPGEFSQHETGSRAGRLEMFIGLP